MTVPTGVNPRMVEGAIYAIFFPSGNVGIYINLFLLGSAALMYALTAWHYRLFLGGDTRSKKDIGLEILFMVVTGFLVSPLAGFFSMHLFIKSLSYVRELANKYGGQAIGENPITKRRVISFVGTVVFFVFAYVSLLISTIVFALMLEQEIYPFHLFPGVIVAAIVSLVKKPKNLPCYNTKPRFSNKVKLAIKIVGIAFPVVFGTLFITTGFIKIHGPAPGTQAVSGNQLTIMTYNIRNPVIIEDNPADDWINRGPDLVGYVDTFSPDVLCVQEAPLSAVEYLKTHLGSANFQYTGFGRFDGVHGDEHNAIFFDSDQFNFVDGDTFWLSDFPDYPSTTWFNFFLRICTWAVLENKTDGTRFCVFNTHFDFWEYFQTRAAKLIKERMDRYAGGLPVFFTGDLNMGNTTEAFQLLKNHGNKALLDSYTGPATTSSSFDFIVDPSDTSGRIDFILVSTGVTVNNCTVPHDARSNGRTYSDHYPVILNCTI